MNYLLALALAKHTTMQQLPYAWFICNPQFLELVLFTSQACLLQAWLVVMFFRACFVYFQA